jgi:hypothetical protein
MSVNRDKPHVLVLPEDGANLQLAKGFHLQVDWTQFRQMQVLNPTGGWTKVLKQFQSDHVVEMQKYPGRFMVLLIDFDGRRERLDSARAKIPEHLTDGVFILGALTTPEALKQDLGPYEEIGSAMAKDCRDGTDSIWGHRLLQHNAREIDRLRTRVRPILFPSNG